MSLPEYTFPIGTEFTTRHGRKAKVVDHLTTTNSKGCVVKFRYMVEYTMAGRNLKDHDVVHTSIARALAEERQPA